MHTIEKLINFKKKRPEITDDMLAKGVGVSRPLIAGLIQDFLGVKPYGGNKPNNYRKIEKYLQFMVLTENAVPPIPFIETTESKKVWDTLEFALINREMVSIIGDSGRGKTRSINEWVLDHEEAIYINAFASCNNVLFFETLARILKIDPALSAGRIILLAIDKLQNSNRAIVVDDSHYNTFRTMANLRYIHDEANVGLIIAGTPWLFDQMEGPKRRQWEQIYSRFSVRTTIGDLSLEDATTIILSVFPNTTESQIKKTWGLSRGSVSELCNYLQRARAASGKKKALKMEAVPEETPPSLPQNEREDSPSRGKDFEEKVEERVMEEVGA